MRRDEAQAKAREEEQERRMQEVDADRRIKILRGEDPSHAPPQAEAGGTHSRSHAGGDRKRRRIAGEDDTDRDIRYAREHVEQIPKREELVRKPSSDAPLTDHAGHISLFPTESSPKNSQKNAEAEDEAAKKKKEYEDQYTMRFSNAAGFKQSLESPWYSCAAGARLPKAQIGKDVWGNEDLMRREREKTRTDANDPLAAMKKGVSQLRKADRDRRKWNDEREKELVSLKTVEKDRRKRRRRRSSGDELEGFSLDSALGEREQRHRRNGSHEHGHRSRSRSRSRSRDKHRRRSGMMKSGSSHSRDDTSKRESRESGWIKAPGKRYSAQFATPQE